jgi:hypothetical protein
MVPSIYVFNVVVKLFMHVIIVLKKPNVLLISISKLEWVGSCAMLFQLGTSVQICFSVHLLGRLSFILQACPRIRERNTVLGLPQTLGCLFK